ncbi:MAG: glycosyltransferase [Ekhidna sp.]
MEDRRKKIVFLTSYPPRECGIATFSFDLISALKRQFGETFKIEVCALENGKAERVYAEDVSYQLDVTDPEDVEKVLHEINDDGEVVGVCLQHEFGLFVGMYGKSLLDLIGQLDKPLFTTFHTVLPKPDIELKGVVEQITSKSHKVIVMTKNAMNLLVRSYRVSKKRIVFIPHGTHLVNWKKPEFLKKKYGLEGHLVLSTFGLLGPNKSIETTLKALPEIITSHPSVKFLILGKTHPELVKQEGEKYRSMLKRYVKRLDIENNVLFINKYLSLDELLEYLQLTDVYLFTSKDPNQAVSGTFAYALSCACPIVSTPIPHAIEMLDENVGKIVAFEDHTNLALETRKLLSSHNKRAEMSLNAFHKTRMTIWENVAIQYAQRFQQCLPKGDTLKYSLPPISLRHLKRMTTDEGMLQFSSLGIPSQASGFTLDDNARAMIAMITYYAQSGRLEDLRLIERYFTFIKYCQKPNGRFNNYVDIKGEFHKQNAYTNLEDSNGRAIWALGYLVSNASYFPDDLVTKAIIAISQSADWMMKLKSPRSIAFVIKGLYYHNQYLKNQTLVDIVEKLSDRLVQHYVSESHDEWDWFESYLTYANGVMPEALLLAYDLTGYDSYQEIAIKTFDFLISKIFKDGKIKVISNRGWLNKGDKNAHFGEQPIDVAYTILALDNFYRITGNEKYKSCLETAFEWFLGNNHLNQIIHNPISGGCYDGLEENHPNLNEGAESTVCYLMARLIMEKYFNTSVSEPSKLPAIGKIKRNRDKVSV